MKHELSCSMAQTLMPLSVDGATDRESEAALQAHLAVCPACSSIYESMKADAGAVPFGTNEKALFRKARTKLWLRIALMAVICCAVCAGLWIGYLWLNNDSVLKVDEYVVAVEKVPAEAFLLVDAGGGDYLAHLVAVPGTAKTKFHEPFLLTKNDYQKLQTRGFAYYVQFYNEGRNRIDDVSDCFVKDGKLQVVLWSYHKTSLFGRTRTTNNDCMIYDDFSGVYNAVDGKENKQISWSSYLLEPGKDGG